MKGFIAIQGNSLSENVTYPEFVDKLAKKLPPDVHLAHMALGVGGEAGELQDAIKKFWIYGKPLDLTNCIEELGDLMFYMQGIMNGIGVDWEQVARFNVEKLKKRYPGVSYSNEAAVARADKAAAD